MTQTRGAIERLIAGLAGLLILLLLGSCSAIEADGPAFEATIQAQPDVLVGQTFRAEWDGLRGIDVFQAPVEARAGSLQVSLYRDPAARNPLWQGEVDLPPGPGPTRVTVPVGVQPRSSGRTYYITFETVPGAAVNLSTAPGGYYTQGALYRDGAPLNRQLDFHLQYSTPRAALGLAREALPAVGVLLVFGLLFTFPGWALFSGLWAGWERQDLLNRLILASLAGTAVYPVLLLWTRLAGLQVGPYLPWVVPGGALLWFAWRFRRGDWRPEIRLARPDAAFTALTLVFLAVLITRLLPLRGLDAGLWGDSYHHTLITQLLVQRGGLFSSWEPYAPIVTFTYHFGFHTTAAVLEWVLRMGSERSVLWAGQLLNVLAVAGLAPLAGAVIRRLGGGERLQAQARLAGIVAIVAVGLLSPMPMFYTNWGRYTQIAGQALLLAWMVVALDVFEGGPDLRRDALGWLLLGGLALTHYRVLIFAVLWIAAFLIVRLPAHGIVRGVKSLWRAGAGAALLFLPWFWAVFGGGLMDILGAQLGTPAAEVSEAVEAYSRLGDLTRFLPVVTWGLLTLVLIWGFQRREKAVYIFSLWGLFVLLSANPGWLGLPGAGAINNFAVLIAAYIPAGVLLGLGAAWAWEAARERAGETGQAGRLAAPLALSLALLAGGALQVGLVNVRAGSLVTAPDLEAFQWVRDNTPQEAVFLVNAVEAGGGNTLAGTDGGWWLPFFTRRRTTLPPFIYISEKTDPPDLRLDLLDLYGEVLGADLDTKSMFELLRSRGVTHLYLGQQQGGVNGKSERIDPNPLKESRFYDLVYHVDRVWIYELIDR